MLLFLAAIYFVLGITGALLVIQPPENWLVQNTIQKKLETNTKLEDNRELTHMDSLESHSSTLDKNDPKSVADDADIEGSVVPGVSWKQAFKRKEFYLLWATRLSVVLITQVVAAMYKSFGQTFIYDDQFLAFVGSISAIFNCSGRLVYGLIMDKTSYRIGMSIEAILLTLLVSTFYLTSIVDTGSQASDAASAIMSENACRRLEYQLNYTEHIGINVQDFR